MTKVAILPVPSERGDVSYCAIAGDKQTQGKSAGEALDALTSQLSEGESGTLVIIQNRHSDRFFDAAQQKRLVELMERWRVVRDKGEALPAGEQSELEAITRAELRATTDLAAALLDELRK